MTKKNTYRSFNNSDSSAKTCQQLQTLATVERHNLTTQHQRDFETNFDHRGARLYDADAGRVLSLDPLTADFPSWSDYNYVLGNPIAYDAQNRKFWREGNLCESV